MSNIRPDDAPSAIRVANSVRRCAPGSSLVMALQTIVSRTMSPHNSAVVTVGAFLSGNAGNVIAQSAILRLSIRTTTPDDRKLVLGKVRSITKAQAESFGCSHEIREGVPGAVLLPWAPPIGSR